MEINNSLIHSTLDSLDVSSDEPITLKSLYIEDEKGNREYYVASVKEIQEYRKWKKLIELTEGKEMSWNVFYDDEPVEGPDGFYVAVCSGGCAIAEVVNKQIIHKEVFSSSRGYLWSHIERYYEELEKESSDTDGTLRIESTEV
jgi:hypothetical protein